MAKGRLLFVIGAALALAVVCRVASAQTKVWEPRAGHKQMEIWPHEAPDANAEPPAGPETSHWWPKGPAGPPGGFSVENVSRPTMTVYSPPGKNTGIAVVVFPGGGYQELAIDLEGTEVCDWLTAKGITCVLLKYRVPNSGMHWDEKCQCQMKPKAPTALEDAQRTLGLLRLHAAEWGINPHKIGVLGFSAGGHLVADISTHWDTRMYAPVDEADKKSCRPDFAVALYPGHLWIDTKKFELNPDIRVTKETPPTFIVQARDDNVDSVKNSQVYYRALKDAGVPVEMHLFAHGGHAFGLRLTKLPITKWPELAEKWLAAIGMMETGR